MYKILSLDGGGSWSVIQARTLAHLYGSNTPGREILVRFRLVAANSGGSLVLAALALNLSPAQIVQLLDDYQLRNQIFRSLPWYRKWKQALLGMGPQYEAEAKRAGLAAVLHQASGHSPNVMLSKISQLLHPTLPETDFLIATFDYDRERATFMRSDLFGEDQTQPIHNDYTLLDAIHSASHAPVNFFEKTADGFSLNPDGSRRGFRHWDGAVGGYNNPVLAALTEAVGKRIPLGDIRILSIGTGTVRLPLDRDFPEQAVHSDYLFQSTGESSMMRDIPKLAMSILGDPPDSASYISYVMLHGEVTHREPACLIRMNPLIAPVWNGLAGMWMLPEGYQGRQAAFSFLTRVEMDAVSQEEYGAVREALHYWERDLLPNQPVQFDRFFQPKIGHALFSEACAAWKNWD